MKVSGKGD